MPPRKRKVDETVENQLNPGTSETERASTQHQGNEPQVAKMAPAMEVDETVENQINPGINMIDRNPGQQIVTDSAGIAYDVSKTTPELIQEDREEEKNAIRQKEGALNAADWREDEQESTEVYFLEGGLTTNRVWKKGETLRVPKGEEFDWMNLSGKEQEDLYGRVMFEKR